MTSSSRYRLTLLLVATAWALLIVGILVSAAGDITRLLGLE